jgi:hypothetical protein
MQVVPIANVAYHVTINKSHRIAVGALRHTGSHKLLFPVWKRFPPACAHAH